MILLLALLSIGTALQAEERITLRYSQPDDPGSLRASLHSGRIEVRPSTGSVITVSAAYMDGGLTTPTPDKADGLTRIESGVHLTVEEENNDVHVVVQEVRRPVRLIIEVPVRTALSLKTVSSGDIFAEGIDGDHSLETGRGNITLREVSGSVVANVLNGDLDVSMVRVKANQVMAFSSLKGDIDLTLPNALPADLRIETQRGEVFTDFTLEQERTGKPTGGNRDGKGRFVAGLERAVYAKINGGGPRININVYDGDVYLRKRD